LQAAVRKQRKCFEQETPPWPPPEGVAADLHAGLAGDPRLQIGTAERPKGLKVTGSGGEDRDIIACRRQKTAEAIKVDFGTAQSRRIPLDKMSNVNGTPCLSGG
jgi:hypothetical protein